MTYEVYRYISIGAAIACGLMIALSVVLFFVLKIPRVISDLSGRTARRAIEDIRRQNEATGDKSHRPSFVNLHRGKVTDKISNSRRIQHPTAAQNSGGNATTKIPTQNLKGRSQKMPGNTGRMPAQQPYAPRHVFQGEETTILPEMNATTILPENEMTTVLPENNVTTVLPENDVTTVLPGNDPVPSPFAESVPAGIQETTILPAGNETTVLYAGNETSVLYAPPRQAAVDPAAVFAVEKEITFVHTPEVIPMEAVYGR